MAPRPLFAAILVVFALICVVIAGIGFNWIPAPSILDTDDPREIDRTYALAATALILVGAFVFGSYA